MNLILAVALVALARVGMLIHAGARRRFVLAIRVTQPAAVFLQSHSDSAAGRLARAAKFDRHELGNLLPISRGSVSSP